MKKIINIFIFLILLILSLVLLVGCNNNNNNELIEKVEWPYEQEYIPIGDFTSSIEKNNTKVFYKTDMTNDEFLSYIDTLRLNGFELNILESDFESFEHLNHVDNSEHYTGKINICLVKGFMGHKDYRSLHMTWYDKAFYLEKTKISVDNALEITIK